jgi:hypothetical protein
MRAACGRQCGRGAMQIHSAEAPNIRSRERRTLDAGRQGPPKTQQPDPAALLGGPIAVAATADGRRLRGRGARRRAAGAGAPCARGRSGTASGRASYLSFCVNHNVIPRPIANCKTCW